MKKARRSGRAQGPRDAAQRTSVSPEDAEREWLISLFASLEQERGDLETFLASRVEQETRKRRSASADRCPI